MRKTDCVMYRHRSCVGLEKLNCDNCSFYKNAEMKKASDDSARKRCEEKGYNFGVHIRR